MYFFQRGTNIIIPEAITKKMFLRVIPPPDMIKVEHNHIHKRASSPNPIALPIPIHADQISSLITGVSTGALFSLDPSLIINTQHAPIAREIPPKNIIMYSGASSPGLLIKERIHPPTRAAII